MANVDEEFIKDLQQCLEAADQLSDLNTEEAKLFVSQQIQDLHRFLQKKQKDAEDRIDEEIKKEEKEISELKDRIERTTKSDGTKESDIAYRDLGLLWTVLKDEYWQLAFNAFISETKDSVKDILANLIAILKVSFAHCKDRAATKPLDPAVMKNVKEDKSVAKHFKYESKLLLKEVEKYLEKCVEFSWIACFEEPEVSLITMPKNECKKIARKFEDLDNTTHLSRPNSKYVEWPAIVQGDKIVFQWHLRIINQPRPQPKDMGADQSQVFRVTGVEGKDRSLHDDLEDNTKDPTQTQSETVMFSSDAPGSIVKKGVPESQHIWYSLNVKQKDEVGKAGDKQRAEIIAGEKKKITQNQTYKPVSTNKGLENLKF